MEFYFSKKILQEQQKDGVAEILTEMLDNLVYFVESVKIFQQITSGQPNSLITDQTYIQNVMANQHDIIINLSQSTTVC